MSLERIRRLITIWLKRPLPFALAAIFTVLTAFLLLKLDAVEAQRLDLAARATTGRRLDDLRARLEKSLTAPILSTRGVVAEIVAHGDIAAKTFARVAAMMTEGYPSVRNITLARGTVIGMVYPSGSDEIIVGTDYRTQAHQWGMIERSITTRTTLLQGPTTLIQGGTGLIVRSPVYLPGGVGREDQFFGVVSAVINIPVVLAEVGLDRDDLPIQVAIRGRDGLGTNGDVFFGDEAVFRQNPVETDVTLPYGSWRMAAVAKQGADANAKFERDVRRALAALLLILVATSTFGTAHHIATIGEANRLLREREDALDGKSQELLRSNADLQQFAYVASHDLREPLRMVRSYVTLLEKHFGDRLDPTAREYIAFARDGAERMDRMMVDLLELSRVGRSDVPAEPVPLSEVVESARMILGLAIDESSTQIVVDGNLPAVLGRRNDLTRLFQNLIGNGLKYRSPDRSPIITLTAQAGDGEWIISVADNGIGIAKDHFGRIFDVFQRLHTKDEYTGTGIGLAISKKIVEHHGGRIWVESVPGKGSTFFFTLPDAPANA